MDVKLDILNAMLGAIGSASIQSTVGRHPSLRLASPILDRVNRKVQARGHWFNTDWKLKLTPTSEKWFVLPDSTLKADTSDPALPFVRRGRYMYDPINHSRVIDVPSIEVDVVTMVDYDELPWTAVDLIQCMSIWELVQSSDVDGLTLNSRSSDLKNARQAFEVERLAQSDFRTTTNPTTARLIGGMKPMYHRRAPGRIGG